MGNNEGDDPKFTQPPVMNSLKIIKILEDLSITTDQQRWHRAVNVGDEMEKIILGMKCRTI